MIFSVNKLKPNKMKDITSPPAIVMNTDNNAVIINVLKLEVPTGLEPILFWTKTKCVTSYTMGL